MIVPQRSQAFLDRSDCNASLQAFSLPTSDQRSQSPTEPIDTEALLNIDPVSISLSAVESQATAAPAAVLQSLQRELTIDNLPSVAGKCSQPNSMDERRSRSGIALTNSASGSEYDQRISGNAQNENESVNVLIESADAKRTTSRGVIGPTTFIALESMPALTHSEPSPLSSPVDVRDEPLTPLLTHFGAPHVDPSSNVSFRLLPESGAFCFVCPFCI